MAVESGRPAASAGRFSSTVGALAVTLLGLVAAAPAHAQAQCARTLTADVVALDQPLMFNRLGASNINGMVFALKRDVINRESRQPLTAGGSASPGNVELRPDKRPRPLVLRVAAGDCLRITLTNLLTPTANPFKQPRPTDTPPFNLIVDDQVADRTVGLHVAGMQLVNSIADDSSYVGRNASSLVRQGDAPRTYTLFAEKEGVFLLRDSATMLGSDRNQGNSSNGLFGQVIVEPKGARIYRSAVTEEEMRLVTTGRTASGHPVIDYEARYPTNAGSPTVWDREGKGGLPILNMVHNNAIVHSELEAMIVGPNADGSFPPDTYPLESTGRRNPTVPNRLEPFRDFAQVWHDEVAAEQAFPAYYNDPVFGYVLKGVRDAFMINYGSGGIGSEIIANRIGVGPMHDCLSCAYEEFFLSSFAVGDPALLVDVPANVGLENLGPGQTPPPGTTGPKANRALYPADPSNVHHSYIGDFVKFRNTHIGKEQHVFHLHNHQWLFNPNDDNSNYIDAQGIGPGAGYTYEINFGGSGNRNKSAGDAIFHCHFYPHFAQGMWYHWRNYDVLEEGTRLAVSGTGNGFHTTPWALQDGTPAAGTRAHPDGELAVGVPIVAIVPLPGKAMPPLPARVTVKPNPITVPGTATPVGSLAEIDRADMVGADGIAGTDDDRNPGYPFWIAGIESLVGQRPPTPVLDMITPAQVAQAQSERRCRDNASGRIVGAPPCPAGHTETANPLWSGLAATQADGWHGGLPRSGVLGYAAGGSTKYNIVSPHDFSKAMAVAAPVYFPELGTEAERVAMHFHSKRRHPTVAATLAGSTAPASFVTNGAPPAVGAPFHEPCVDDNGRRLSNGVVGSFFSGEKGSSAASVNAFELPGFKNTRGASRFNADNPRIYKGVNIQFDAVLNKAGYHYPQQRILTLWEDAWSVIEKQIQPEPLVMRLNTFDCAVYSHANLVPEYFEMDDYQIRTPTDIIGQHIHLPKWDLTSADGAANGWNYEDGTFAPGMVRERVHAINEFNIGRMCSRQSPVLPPTADDVTPTAWTCAAGTPLAGQSVTVPKLKALAHPFFGRYAREDWIGARTTMQRWFADPVVNTDGFDRGLGVIFTHDHYGPSTHQQVGLYATVLTEPAGSRWVHNETGQQLGAGPDGSGGRMDGGPTSWQAAILPPTSEVPGNNTQSHTVAAYREFYLEFADFQHAYEAGVYVGAGPDGKPLPGATPHDRFMGVPRIEDAFRYAINPPARTAAQPLFPDLVLEAAGGKLPGCPQRPCPQAISVEDPGMWVVNYRNEPIGLRVFDPNKTGPDGKKGAQADGIAGDLAFALSSRLIDKSGVVTPITRAIPALNRTEQELGFWQKTLNAPGATLGGDPLTPMLRAYAGDNVRVKIQAGGHEEEHTATILGLKWLQGGGGHGKAPNSGWRSAQAAGISEQFTFTVPLQNPVGTADAGGAIDARDYVYSIDTSHEGWWSGTWGLMRSYNSLRPDLVTLPSNPAVKPDRVVNKRDWVGVCPASAPVRNVEVVAILANDLLPRPAGVSIVPADPALASKHAGGTLNPNGGTLVYNPRSTVIPQITTELEDGSLATLGGRAGPLHDPTAMLYVLREHLMPRNARAGGCRDSNGMPGVANAQCPVQLRPGRKVEPLILRANAGDCLNVTLYNRLPQVAPDLPTLGKLFGIVKRDRTGVDGSVPFDVNLVRPSSHAGLSPQYLHVDVIDDLGINAGINITQTAPPVDAAGKTGKYTYQWYAGDVTSTPSGNGVALTGTPVEFGGFGLLPADMVKQGQKSLMGGMVVVPRNTVIATDAGSSAQANVCPAGTSAAACAGSTPPAGSMRDLMLVMAKNLNHRYADGSPVENMAGDQFGVPEDAKDNTHMAFNYAAEPLWFRFGLPPNAPFGNAGCGAGKCYGAIGNMHEAYSNALVGGDPVTPVFTAKAGVDTRLHVTVPHGTSRGTVFGLHGHLWQRDPYVCNGESRNQLPGACNMAGTGSKSIGINPMGKWFGGQDGIAPMSSWTFHLPKAGGANAIPGDYLFRDLASFGNAAGLWGLLRVVP